MALGTALINELEAWNAGHRNSETISRDWIEVFHPDKVAKKILEMAAEEDGFQTHGPTR
jgi:hypothetical protein